MPVNRNFVSVIGVLSLTLLLAGGDAWAGGKRGGGRSGGGNSGGAQREVTRTGPGGSSRSWSQDRSVQRGNGGYESRTTRTNPNGATRTKSAVAERTDTVAERSENGRSVDTTWSDARGNTATREVSVTRDREAGTRTKDVVFTGRDGETRSRSSVTQRTDDGRTTSTVFTDAQGNTATRDTSVTRDPDAGTRTKQVDWTGPEGQTASRTTLTERTDDGRTTTTTIVRPDGSSVTREYSASRDPGSDDGDGQ